LGVVFALVDLFGVALLRFFFGRFLVGLAFTLAIVATAFAFESATLTVSWRTALAAKFAASFAVARRRAIGIARAASFATTTAEARTTGAAWRWAGRMMVLFHMLGELHEFIAAERVVAVGVELFEELFRWRRWAVNAGSTRTAGTVRSAWTIRAWTRTIGTATIAGTSSPWPSAAITVARSAESLAHCFSRGLLFFVVQLPIAILIELFDHLFVASIVSGFALFVAQFAVAVFVMLFEHALTHFFAIGAIAFVAAFRRVSDCRCGQQAHAEQQGWNQISHCHSTSF
jgi:hypothetical protein